MCRKSTKIQKCTNKLLPSQKEAILFHLNSEISCQPHLKHIHKINVPSRINIICIRKKN